MKDAAEKETSELLAFLQKNLSVIIAIGSLVAYIVSNNIKQNNLILTVDAQQDKIYTLEQSKYTNEQDIKQINGKLDMLLKNFDLRYIPPKDTQ